MSQDDRRRILFLYNVRAPFVMTDEASLRARYDVDSFFVQRPHPQLFWEMWRRTRGTNLVVAWFASWHSLPGFMAARLRGIPRLLITGGYDTASLPEINYGLRQGGLPRLVSGMVFRLTDHAIFSSEYSSQEAVLNTSLTADRTSPIWLGVPDHPAFATPVAKEQVVLTVATIDAVSSVRKGLITFVQAARLLPDVQFVLVGRSRDDTINALKEMAPANVTFTGYMSDDDLVALRGRAKVYVQASHHESFGLAVAESMLARCVPVTTQRGGLPEVVGETGVFVDEPAVEPLAAAIRQALATDEVWGERARTHVLEHFPPEARRQGLYTQVEALLGKAL